MACGTTAATWAGLHAPITPSPARSERGIGGGTHEAVRHAVGLTAVDAKELRAGHEEHAPALHPKGPLDGAIGFVTQRLDRRPLRIEVSQPGIAGALVVGAVHPPALLYGHHLGELVEEIFPGHDAAGEEIALHPAVAVG